MIHECVIDQSLNRLLAHFRNRVHVRPPASAMELAELEESAGSLPRDLTILLSTCNGLRVDLEDSSQDAHLCCIREIQNAAREAASPAAIAGFFIVRGDASAAADWLVAEHGPAFGCVVRFDPHVPGATLQASSLGQYVQAWVDFLMECYDQSGRPRVGIIRPRFDSGYIAMRDGQVNKMRKQPELVAWLHELDLAVASGDDFE